MLLSEDVPIDVDGDYEEFEDGNLSRSLVSHGPTSSNTGLFANYTPSRRRTIHEPVQSRQKVLSFHMSARSVSTVSHTVTAKGQKSKTDTARSDQGNAESRGFSLKETSKSRRTPSKSTDGLHQESTQILHASTSRKSISTKMEKWSQEGHDTPSLYNASMPTGMSSKFGGWQEEDSSAWMASVARVELQSPCKPPTFLAWWILFVSVSP